MAKGNREGEVTRQSVADRLASEVLSRLGRPARFEKCEGHPLYGHAFRVNVYCRSSDMAGNDLIVEGRQLVMTDSFYVVERDGGVLYSSPPIMKKY